MRSIVTNIQLCEFEIIKIAYFVLSRLKLHHICFVIVKLSVDTFWNDVSNWIAAKFRINFRTNHFQKLFVFKIMVLYQFINGSFYFVQDLFVHFYVQGV